MWIKLLLLEVKKQNKIYFIFVVLYFKFVFIKEMNLIVIKLIWLWSCLWISVIVLYVLFMMRVKIISSVCWGR